MKCVTDWRKNTGMLHYTINTSDLAEEDLENAGDYIAFVHVVRILHMLVDSRTWLYRTFSIPT